MAKRGLKKGSKCARYHKSGAKKGRCAEYSKSGKARKAAPKKRKGGKSGKQSWLDAMVKRYTGKGKKAKLYTTGPDFAARMQEAREAAQAERLRQNMEAHVPLYGARGRRR